MNWLANLYLYFASYLYYVTTLSFFSAFSNDSYAWYSYHFNNPVLIHISPKCATVKNYIVPSLNNRVVIATH